MDLRRPLALLFALSSLDAAAADYDIAGTVSDYASGQPLGGARVTLLSLTSDIMVHAQTTTDAAGRYRLSGRCVHGCYVSAALDGHGWAQLALPPQPAGALTVPLQLGQASTIAGQVQRDPDSARLRFALRLYYREPLLATYVASPRRLATEANGSYRIAGLGHGDYRLCVVAAPGTAHIDQCWQGHDRPALLAAQSYGTITLGSGEERSGIDFALNDGARIAGRVRHPLNVAADATVEIYDADGALVTQASTNEYGDYASTGLAAGTYYARAVTAYRSGQLYGGASCHDSCDVTAGTPITLAGAGPAVSGIDFEPTPRAYVSGQVRGHVANARSDTPLHGVEVGLMPGYGDPAVRLAVTTSADGSYLLPVPPQQPLRLRAAVSEPWVSVVWPAAPCPRDCPFNDGSDIVAFAGETQVRDFNLAQGASFGGRLFDDAGNAFSGPVSFTLFSADRRVVWRDSGDYPHSYQSWPIAPGSYYVMAEGDGGCEVYPGQVCAGWDELPPGAGVLPLLASAQLTDIDFRLRLDALFADGFDP